MMKSTMNAPLSEAEEGRIIKKWGDLVIICGKVSWEIPDPVKMLDLCAELVGAVWELRRAIDDGWHDANRRAFPDPPRAKKPSKLHSTLSDLEALGFTADQIVEAIREIKDEHEGT